ncbi:DEAD/DEAH box helicase [Bradyrhizobium jicamae]|uniref:DEAD/DEAH box helicase n=1 Tax=Bradyrhizobium jicamae TaxID=280332 RepID=A0ABS5FJB0_9BRAD|nr:DEAD/DEAH box helicase [Bradyrhizobium jicamae]MBR0796866.1 DEAD/DEAH box helicase [Bradyrhizobium jicamae]
MADFVTVTYGQTGASQSVNARGMRAMQARAFDARNSQYLLVKAPPASGKSRALMFIGLDKLENQGLSKVIVAVPERSIGNSFKSTKLTETGFLRDWIVDPKWNLTDSAGAAGKVSAFKAFMASDDDILVCTHATLRFAFDQLGASAFADSVLAIDEFHHVSADENNRLGEVVRALMQEDKAHIVAMTGSYFRGDTAPVLHPEDEGRFNRVTYTYYEQLNGYQYLKTLGIGYHFYRGRYIEAINQVLNSDLKTIVHIPHVRSAESTSDKYDEVDRIHDHLGTVLRKDEETGLYLVQRADGRILKIADLVDDGPERERVMRTLRKIESRDDVDIIIALGMAKEGFDWIWCEHALTVGYRGSLTEVIQIIGRATRDAPDKTHAQFTNLIAEPDASEERVTDAVNNMLKAIACSLLMEQVLAPNFKFRTKADADELDGSRKETDIVYTQDDSIIVIKDFAEPTTERTRQILESDLNDLTAAIIQDTDVLRAGMNPDYSPEIVNQVIIPKVIEHKYPDLTPEEVEEVRQAVVANGVFKSPSIQIEQHGDTKFVRMAERLINIDQLDMDLIDSINPFQKAYEILSKSVTEEVLRTIHAAVASTKISMTEQEAVSSWPRIQAFKKEKGVPPSLVSPNPIERRLAEALAWLQAKKRERAKTVSTES